VGRETQPSINFCKVFWANFFFWIIPVGVIILLVNKVGSALPALPERKRSRPSPTAAEHIAMRDAIRERKAARRARRQRLLNKLTRPVASFVDHIAAFFQSRTGYIVTRVVGTIALIATAIGLVYLAVIGVIALIHVWEKALLIFGITVGGLILLGLFAILLEAIGPAKLDRFFTKIGAGIRAAAIFVFNGLVMIKNRTCPIVVVHEDAVHEDAEVADV
jgi:hypothetical protein